MAAFKTHRDLLAWREGMALVELVYRETSAFPKEERYGLTAQIRRSAVSIPSNIAEGAARNSPGELLQFVGIASGSLAELETQLELAQRLGLLKADSAAQKQSVRVSRFLRRWRSSLRK